MATVPALSIWTVSQLTRRIKGTLEEAIGDVWISGEISNWKVAASGHAYFTLKDEGAQIDAVAWKGTLSRLRFRPDTGIEVLVHGRVSVYERRGQYQIVASEMQPRGLGALQLAFEQLKKRLTEEGLFDADRKKPLPVLPKRIGIVTSPTGAAIRDMLNVLGRRFAGVHVMIAPSKVQGDGASEDIARGIRLIDGYGVDVIIVGRGGGSLEDLWAFNEEPAVRAVAAAQTPIISAVGHEVDFSLTDFAADLRAPTPSAAAELVVKERAVLADTVEVLAHRLRRSVRAHLEGARYRLDRCAASYALARPEELLRDRRLAVDDLQLRLGLAAGQRAKRARQRLERAVQLLATHSPERRLRRAVERCAVLRERLRYAGQSLMDGHRARLAQSAAKLAALSPVAILGRGYALAFRETDQALVKDAAALSPGELLRIRFGNGRIRAEVREVLGEESDG